MAAAGGQAGQPAADGPAAAAPTVPPASPVAFPESWVGAWSADAEVRRPGPVSAQPGAAKPMSFVMELHIGPELPREAGAKEPPDLGPRRWAWTIIYDGSKSGGPPRQERSYELLERDAAKGAYEIDEKNSIILPATLIGDALVSPFEIGGSMLLASYRFHANHEGPDDDEIVVEIISIPLANAESTGNAGGVPEVKGYPAASTQRAVLRRKA